MCCVLAAGLVSGVGSGSHVFAYSLVHTIFTPIRMVRSGGRGIRTRRACHKVHI
ncbi:hypothetical protein BDV19DRAFT_368652 [Aspergillus venezuelensis]